MIDNLTEDGLKHIINRLRAIRETKIMLSKEELDLSQPTFTDVGMIRNIRVLFNEFHAHKKTPMKRKQFILIILFLYSPYALGGGKMRRGLRKELGEVLNCSCSNVSHDYKNVSFYYMTYKNFRTDVNEFLKYLLERYEKEKEV